MLMGTDSSSWPIDAEWPSTTSVKRQLLEGFRTSKEYRHAFVEEKVRTGIAAQIKAIREQRRMTQPQLAGEMERSQSWVSRLEDPNQPPPTISTLLQVAMAFDVDLDIRFDSFSELLDRLGRMGPDSFEVPAFEEDPGLQTDTSGSDTDVSDILMVKNIAPCDIRFVPSATVIEAMRTTIATPRKPAGTTEMGEIVLSRGAY
jgi:transcriptional regulator with XRE-family HTH domain